MKKRLLVALASLGTAFGTALPAEAIGVNLGPFNQETWSYTVDFDEPDLSAQAGTTHEDITFEYEGLETTQYLKITSLNSQKLKLDERAGYGNVLTTDNSSENAQIRFDFLKDNAENGQRLRRLSFLDIGNVDSYVKVFFSTLGKEEIQANPSGEVAADGTSAIFRLGAETEQDLLVGYEVTSFEVFLADGGAIAEVEFVPEPVTILGSGAALTLGALLRRKRKQNSSAEA
ncbi:PEP-CTERM sorting domain-containing protein [Sphaerothrix gracilis]|uniref:PEP-CTERM sorting domain-containing protein n=1 Tax=Sphaerothrix gracilis TaxID=3151835 RepID=UPI0031FD7CF6